jgi:sodium-dependent dicarboxylate transporter 2/3/5
MKNDQPKLFDLLPLVLGPVFGVLIWLAPFEIPHAAKMTAGIIVWVASWWLSALIPLHISGLVGLLLAHFHGLASWPELLAPYADPIIFLFMGGFFLAQAVAYHELDKWMVQATLSHKKIRGNTQRLFISLVFITAGMSAFLSNTATTALVIPVGLEILKRQEGGLERNSSLLLLLAAAASIGGGITPVGSPPNMIGLGIMEKINGYRPDFLTWVIHMAPLSLLVLMGVLWVYRKEIKSLPKTQGIRAIATPLSTPQKLVATILIITALMWALPGLSSVFGSKLSIIAQQMLPESVVAICAAITLMLTPTRNGPLLPWREAQKIDWATLMLFGSGISLGALAFKSGLASIIAHQMESFAYLSPSFLLAIAIVGTLFITELASNTATANLLLPILLASATFAATPERTVYAVVAASNLAFMLPVGTPPNAIVYSTGLIKLSMMIRKGIWANIIAALVIVVFCVFIYG